MVIIEALTVYFFGLHRYRVKFVYSVAGKDLFTQVCTVGVSKQKTINDHRHLKKINGALHKINDIPIRMLNNGQLSVEPICYLGRWR
jgi:hypothetical protein